MSPRYCGHSYMLSNTRIYNDKERMKTDLTPVFLIKPNNGLTTTELPIMELKPKVLSSVDFKSLKFNFEFQSAAFVCCIYQVQ